MNNTSVAEHHHRQGQKVADENREESNDFLHGIALIDAKRSTDSLCDIRSHSGERNLNCWDDDPDKCDCSIHETLLTVKLLNTAPDFYFLPRNAGSEKRGIAIVSRTSVSLSVCPSVCL